jgi:hypothetical protein
MFLFFKKIIRRNLHKIRFHWRYRFFLNKKSLFASNGIFERNVDSQLDIVTISFNNAKMIEYQILLIKKYLKDSHTHIIADNSSNQFFRQEIQNICSKHNIFYVSIPEIHLKPSWSHAAALHWVFINIIKKRKSPVFGFIDHDIFPVKETFILKKLWNGIYGRVIPPYGTIEISDDQPYWSLWGGFFFFKTSIFHNISKYSFNFFPKVISQNLILDTCGGLWDSVFSKLPRPNQLVSYEEVKIDPDNYENIQKDAYEIIDEWIHFVNLSNWYKSDNLIKKTDFFNKYINKLLQ